jgi:hypothetical protein
LILVWSFINKICTEDSSTTQKIQYNILDHLTVFLRLEKLLRYWLALHAPFMNFINSTI